MPRQYLGRHQAKFCSYKMISLLSALHILLCVESLSGKYLGGVNGLRSKNWISRAGAYASDTCSRHAFVSLRCFGSSIAVIFTSVVADIEHPAAACMQQGVVCRGYPQPWATSTHVFVAPSLYPLLLGCFAIFQGLPTARVFCHIIFRALHHV